MKNLFNYCMIPSIRLVGLFLNLLISRDVCIQQAIEFAHNNAEKNNQSSRKKHLADDRDQKRMARLTRADRNFIVTQINREQMFSK